MAGGLHQILALTKTLSAEDELAVATATLQNAQQKFDEAEEAHRLALQANGLSKLMFAEGNPDITAPNLALLREAIIYKENSYSGDDNTQFIVRVNFGSDTTKDPNVFTVENIDVYAVLESRVP